MTAPPARYAGVPILVLGASGFVGRWVAKLLTAHGARVVCAVRDPARARATFATFGVTGDLAEVDLAAPGELARLFAATRPTVTFNLAGYGVDRSERDERTFTRINVDVVAEVAELVDRYSDAGWPGPRIH